MMLISPSVGDAFQQLQKGNRDIANALAAAVRRLAGRFPRLVVPAGTDAFAGSSFDEQEPGLAQEIAFSARRM